MWPFETAVTITVLNHSVCMGYAVHDLLLRLLLVFVRGFSLQGFKLSVCSLATTGRRQTRALGAALQGHYTIP